MNFVTHLKKFLDQKTIDKLVDSLKENSVHGLLLNTNKMKREDFEKKFKDCVQRFDLIENAYLYNKKEIQLGKTIEHELGAFYLQEPSAMLVSSLIDFKETDYVLDLCAAPGGKTVQASYKMHNKGLILANDLSYSRSVIIKENAERLGLSNLIITNNDFSKIASYYQDFFDKIILDAPCSGSGMFRKNKEMESDWTYEKVLKNQKTQKELILLAYSMLKPDGILSYSTCSFSYEEDEEVITHLLNNTDAELINIKSSPHYYVSKSGIGIHLFPFLFPGEGHYICHIKKPNQMCKHIKIPTINLVKTNIHHYDNVVKFGDFVYGISAMINIKPLSIIRYGVKIGELQKDIVKYNIHYARSINSFITSLDLDLEQTLQYMRGESLNIPFKKGYVLLRYSGLQIDIGKSDGRIIKNRYPKYLRKNISI